ncbi:MAG: hypothetical protein JWL83_3448 [Actinomycetia bacterium]|nr:hypothetical protein [Actinomycetes bacterium]
MVLMMLGGAWGVIVALPLVGFARRQAVLARAQHLLVGRPRACRTPRWRLPRPVVIVGAVLASPARRRKQRARADVLRREIPVAIDLISVAVGAGCTPYVAVEVASLWCPPGVGAALASVPRACRLGASFDDAIRDAGAATPVLAPLTDALDAAARLGVPIAPTLARLAAEARADLRRAAEQRARTVPVRLLFPLVFLVLPAFGLLTVAPVLLDGFARMR